MINVHAHPAPRTLHPAKVIAMWRGDRNDGDVHAARSGAAKQAGARRQRRAGRLHIIDEQYIPARQVDWDRGETLSDVAMPL